MSRRNLALIVAVALIGGACSSSDDTTSPEPPVPSTPVRSEPTAPSTVPTTSTTSTTSTTMPPPETDLEVVDRFVEAFASYDPTAARIVVSDDVALPLYGEADPATARLDDIFNWMEAAGWRWFDVDCSETSPSEVECDLMVTDRLSESIRVTAERPATARFEVDGSQIIEMEHEIGPSRHVDSGGIEPSQGFWEWVVGTYPTDASVMWPRGSNRPAYTASSSELLDEHLTERLGLGEVFGVQVEAAQEFAVSVPDPAWIHPDAEIAIAPGTSNPTIDEQIDWMWAYGWRWDRANCVDDVDEWVRCTFTHNNRLTDAAGSGFDGAARLEIVGDVDVGGNGGVASLEWEADWNAFHEIERPFIEFVEQQSPIDAFAMWQADGTPIVTTETARLLDGYLDDYLDEQPLQVVERFAAALSQYDLAAMRSELGRGAFWEMPFWHSISFATAASMDWVEAWRWQVDLVECGESDTAPPWWIDESHGYVTCTARLANALTDITDTDYAGIANFRLEPGRVVEVMVRLHEVEEEPFATNALDPFIAWAETLGRDTSLLWQHYSPVEAARPVTFMWPDPAADLNILSELFAVYGESL